MRLNSASLLERHPTVHLAVESAAVQLAGGREGSNPSYALSIARLHLQHSIQFQNPWHKEDTGLRDHIQQRSSSLTYFRPLRIIFLWIIKECWHVVIKFWLQTMNQVPGREWGKEWILNPLWVHYKVSNEKSSIKWQDSWNFCVMNVIIGNSIILFKRPKRPIFQFIS